MERASARFANRGGGGRSVRLHLCATFCKRCTATRSNQRSVTARSRTPRARQSCGVRMERGTKLSG
eukprot:325911-Lingulodinium_polyedra.AAC.1